MVRCLRCLFFFLSQVSLLFEGENLAQASPATVSRCGMVYNDYTDLGWTPYVQSWLDKRHKVCEEQAPWLFQKSRLWVLLLTLIIFLLQAEVEHLKLMFDKYIEKVINFKKSSCKELITITELNGVMSLCRLYDALATADNGVRRHLTPPEMFLRLPPINQPNLLFSLPCR